MHSLEKLLIKLHCLLDHGLPFFSPPDKVSACCDALQKEPFNNASGETIRITLSMGIAVYPQHGITAGEVIKSADMALYQAKADGKNKIEIRA